MEAAGLLNTHPARGLFLDPAYVRTLLGGANSNGGEPVAHGGELHAGPLGRLREVFGLSAAETGVVLLAAAPEIDPRYESIYAYLHNDVTRKAPSIELAVRLFLDGGFGNACAHRLFHPSGALLREHLVTLTGERFPSRSIAADARVAGFLLGDDAIDERLWRWTHYSGTDQAGMVLPFADECVNLWRKAFESIAPGGLILLRGRPGAGKCTIAEVLCHSMGMPLLAARPAESCFASLGLLRREARLRKSAVYIAAPAAGLLVAVRIAFEGSGVPVICGRQGRHDDDRAADYVFDVPLLTAPEQRALWERSLTAAAEGIEEVSAKFSLTAGQIAAASNGAMRAARLRGSACATKEELHRAAREQAGTGLLRLAARVELAFEWKDLVLPAHVIAQLREICSQVRNRERVYREWGFGSRLGPARGTAVLFAGPSGTGKTMSAGVIARELGLELYRIDLATVVSKYIGETEKNLSQIFEQAEDSNAILFFDEADALFGKRSEVKDAHDRYANLEIAYLLQRMETYSGIAILATNLMANVDEAFARRMAHLVDFPFPDVPLRQRLWRQCIPPEAPLGPDVNLTALANQFHLAGGNIRNITLAAAFVASEQGCPIGMDHLIRATARELSKIGRQPSRAEFSDFYSMVQHRQ